MIHQLNSGRSINTIKFQRCGGNPIIPRTPGTFYSVYSANPDLLFFNGEYFLYFRGQAEAGHDQIGVAYASPEEFDGIHWEMSPENPVIRVGAKRTDFDSGHILDPAAIVLNNQVYLYYSAHNIEWKSGNIPSYIGLAISEDGTHFIKSIHNPIVPGTAPEIVRYNNRSYLFLQRKNRGNYFEIHCCQSKNGIHFPDHQQQVVFGPSKQANTFDQFSISTVRIWKEENWFFMFYGGCERYLDYPGAIGLARSCDLLNWERYPCNPILERGLPGSWDEGALWFATVYKKDNTYYLWYEGTGTESGLFTPEAREASRQCREDDYGGYGKTSFSQIGLAMYHGDITAW